MIEIFRGLKGLVKPHHVTIDSSIFRLHYGATVTFLLAFSLIVTTRQYVGNPIDCVHTKDIPEDVLNTYCWIHSTYTIPSAFWKRIGIDVAHPGIDKTIDPEERRYVRYYQWVCFCLFFQVEKNKSLKVKSINQRNYVVSLLGLPKVIPTNGLFICHHSLVDLDQICLCVNKLQNTCLAMIVRL